MGRACSALYPTKVSEAALLPLDVSGATAILCRGMFRMYGGYYDSKGESTVYVCVVCPCQNFVPGFRQTQTNKIVLNHHTTIIKMTARVHRGVAAVRT